jgi:hypothetical protein
MEKVIHFPNQPIEFVMPSSSKNNGRDITIKTIPSASKVLYKAFFCHLCCSNSVSNYSQLPNFSFLFFDK